MTTYLDANFLVRMYLELPGCNEAVELVKSRSGRRSWPFPVTHLLRMEVVNALYRLVFESRTGGQWRVTPESASMAFADFEQDLADGLFLARSALTLEEIGSEFDGLAARYTSRHGFRTYDVIHVASARTMGSKRFFTFDNKAKKLAKLAGLEVN
ncbi:MAG TPA: type II toxin-antitoxin system VapC family toxin [Lacipirellulaceae bacterium]|nr:type II toxin-antitoxin system VapC family toxin [Lacipirellulaceae bacterium]